MNIVVTFVINIDNDEYAKSVGKTVDEIGINDFVDNLVDCVKEEFSYSVEGVKPLGRILGTAYSYFD